MSGCHEDQTILSRLVGCWQGTLLHRAAADQPFVRMAGTSENRWVLGGRFVEMTLRADLGGEDALVHEPCEKRQLPSIIPRARNEC